jgi:hypothetical protein
MIFRRIFPTLYLIALFASPVHAGKHEYEVAVQAEVHRWAMTNRIDQGRLHRDKHSDCLLSAILATTVNADGTLARVSVLASSGVPILDKYYIYATQQAALLFPPMQEYFAGAPPEQLNMELRYVLDTRDEQGRRAHRSMRPCEILSAP